MKRRIHPASGLYILFTLSILVGIIIIYYANKVQVNPQTTNLSSNNKSKSSQNKTTQPTSETADWKTYSNLTFGYEIKYPKDWTKEEGKYTRKSSAQDYAKFISLNFNFGNTPDKIIEKGYFVVVRVLPLNINEGYSGTMADFAVKKDFKIDNYNATEYIVKNIDESETGAPAQINFKTSQNLVLIDGWFSAQDQNEFIPIFEDMAKTFKIS